MAPLHAEARIRVVVAAEQWLVAESVRAALSARGHSVHPVGWPGESTPPLGAGVPLRPQVGLLINDLDRWTRVRASCLVVSRIPTRWVVITGAPRGPLWGAVLDAGARAVLPAATSLEETNEILLRVAAGRDGAMPAAERERLHRSWLRSREERQAVEERLRSLTPRERNVLRLLYTGESVAGIAARYELSPATVRSQVKSVLRKLEVNNQLGAVAVLGRMLRTDRDASLLPGRAP